MNKWETLKTMGTSGMLSAVLLSRVSTPKQGYPPVMLFVSAGWAIVLLISSYKLWRRG